MDFVCPKCSKDIPDTNVSVADRMAQCNNCHSIFSLSELSGDKPNETKDWTINRYATGTVRTTHRMEMGMPDRITKTEDFSGLHIRRRWFTAGSIFMFIFGIFWNAFMVFWFTIAITQGVLIMAAFGSVHAAVGIGIMYGAIASFVNTTTITVGSGELKIRHHPLPWPGAKTFARTDIRQLYGKKRVYHSNKGSSTRYELRALTIDGRDIIILKGDLNADHVLYLEQEIERYWGIVDEPVRGSMRED